MIAASLTLSMFHRLTSLKQGSGSCTVASFGKLYHGNCTERSQTFFRPLADLSSRIDGMKDFPSHKYKNKNTLFQDRKSPWSLVNLLISLTWNSRLVDCGMALCLGVMLNHWSCRSCPASTTCLQKSGEGVQSELKQVWFLCFTGRTLSFFLKTPWDDTSFLGLVSIWLLAVVSGGSKAFEDFLCLRVKDHLNMFNFNMLHLSSSIKFMVFIVILVALRSELSGAGALRWDISSVLSQTWRLLHMGRCTVSSCWPRTSRHIP